MQRGVFASQAAAREAGRAMGTAPDPVSGHERALRAAQLAVEDQSVEATDLRLAYGSNQVLDDIDLALERTDDAFAELARLVRSA